MEGLPVFFSQTIKIVIALLSLSLSQSEWAWSLSWNDRMWAHDVLLGGTEKALRHLSSPPADIYYLVKDFTPIATTSRSIFACCCEAAPLVKLRLLTVTECVAPFRTGEQSGASRKVQNANVGSVSTTSKPSNRSKKSKVLCGCCLPG